DEVLPLLLEPAQLLCPAELQQLPRQHRVVDNDLPRRQRGEHPSPVTATDRWAGSPPPAHRSPTRHALPPTPTRLLRRSPLGRDHAELPAAATDARVAARRDRLAPLALAARGEPPHRRQPARVFGRAEAAAAAGVLGLPEAGAHR